MKGVYVLLLNEVENIICIFWQRQHLVARIQKLFQMFFSRGGKTIISLSLIAVSGREEAENKIGDDKLLPENRYEKA